MLTLNKYVWYSGTQHPVEGRNCKVRFYSSMITNKNILLKNLESRVNINDQIMKYEGVVNVILKKRKSERGKMHHKRGKRLNYATFKLKS